MRKLFISIIGLLLIFYVPPVVAGQSAPPAPDKIVARVMGHNISLRQLDSPSARIGGITFTPSGSKMTEAERLEQRERRLESVLWQLLREDFYRKNRIVATPAEINAFARALFKERRARGPVRVLAEDAVKGWKFDRMLYRQYGGTVIFQQSNPFEPVGAYRKFLEERERAGAFEILDPALKQSFWDYYTGEPEMVVPPAEINYDTPWWLQKPKP